MKSLRTPIAAISGVILGVAITVSSSAFADGIRNVVGMTVAGTASVSVNGAEVTEPAIIVGSTGYAPLRAIGDSLGLDVKWEDGKITLNNAEESGVKALGRRLGELQRKSDALSTEIAALSEKKSLYESYPPGERKMSDEDYTTVRKEYDDKMAEQSALTAEMDALSAQILGTSTK